MNKNTSELTEAALDWAVLEALKPDLDRPDRAGISTFGPVFGKGYRYPSWDTRKYSPSTDWKEGGPIIEREHISPHWVVPTNHINGGWSAHTPGGNGRLLYGPTPLVAAMRCYVASKLGDEVSIPDELV